MPADKPRTLEDMAARLNADRTAFAAVYDRLRPPDTSDFKTLAIQRVRPQGETAEQRDRADMQAALERARDDGWLDKFDTETLRELSDDAQLIVDLQAITNPQVDFDHIGDVNVGTLKAMSRCCRVVCGDDEDPVRGSGFLVGPQLVLTNWHVVSSQIQAESAAEEAWLAERTRLTAEGKTAEADALPRPVRPPVKVHVEFDAIRNRDGTTTKAVEERVVDAWLVVSSPDSVGPVVGGLERKLPDDLAELTQCLDFAVLELANPVGYARGWYELSQDLAPPRANDRGVLVQFPGTFAMRVTAGTFTDGKPALPARVRHVMNAIGGSSGGLCATTAFEPVALHQGSLRLAKKRDAVEGKTLETGVQNVAIPLGLIAAAAQERISLRAREAPALVYRTPAGHPVVGRQDLQRAIHDSIYGANRIVVVRNSFDTQTGQLKNGIGKSFTVKILEAMTRSAETLIRTVSAENLPVDPYAAARAIAAPFRDAATVPAAIQAFDAIAAAAPHGDTTQDADIRALADTLLTALRLAAGERMLWLVIDDLDRHPVDGNGPTANLLNTLYQAVAVDARLRVLLIGPTVNLPLLEELKARVDGPLRDIEPGEIEQWIMRARDADRPLDRNTVAILQQTVFAILPGWRMQDPLSRTGRIAQILTEVIGPQLA